MQNLELSEVVFGLVLNNRLPSTSVRPEWFHIPYDTGIEVLQKRGSTKEDVAKVVSSDAISDAHDAVHKWNGIGDKENFDWVKALRQSYENHVTGKELEKIAKKLKDNDEVDILQLYGKIGSAIANESFGLRRADEIDYKGYKPFKPCGYAPIDETLGGLPSDGPIIVLAPTGIGKSRFAAGLINALLHKYTEETAAVYTLEMPDDHWMWRTMNLFPSLKEVLPRLHVSGSVRDIEELVAEVTAKRVNYVVLDDVDNIVKTNDASEYERVYRRVKEICRFMKIPVFVLAQPNRVSKIAIANGERFPSKYDAAWSGASENSAALFMTLMTTNGLDMKSEEFPTVDEDMDYICFWKSRDGWMGDYDNTKAIGPGAVVMKHNPSWAGKAYGTKDGKYKLWPVNSGGKAIGKNKKKDS